MVSYACVANADTFDVINANDTRAGSLQNYPVINSAESGGAGTPVTGMLQSAPDAMYRLEFFANVPADAPGAGEDQVFLGRASVQTDGAGQAALVHCLQPPDWADECLDRRQTRFELSSAILSAPGAVIRDAVFPEGF